MGKGKDFLANEDDEEVGRGSPSKKRKREVKKEEPGAGEEGSGLGERSGLGEQNAAKVKIEPLSEVIDLEKDEDEYAGPCFYAAYC